VSSSGSGRAAGAEAITLLLAALLCALVGAVVATGNDPAAARLDTGRPMTAAGA
jgi:hypothetical protein